MLDHKIESLMDISSHPHLSVIDSPGTYVLILQATQHDHLQVGRLGWLTVTPGYYIYTGSAFGPGGLRARLARHLSKPDTLYWHIDYLRTRTLPEEIWVTAVAEKLEHAWASALRSIPGAHQPLRGFGASDCRCPSHLVYLPVKPEIRALMNTQISLGFPATGIHSWLASDLQAGIISGKIIS
jgi:Uri superfamily endonuclease